MLWINLVNYIAFYIGWMLLVVYGNNVLTISIVYLYLIVHISLAPKKLTELITISVIGAIGFLLETTLLQLNIYKFKSHIYFCPIWFYSLWPLFGSTFNFCLKKIENYAIWFIAPLAGLAAAFSYYAGARLNSSFILPKPIAFPLLVIGLMWTVLFPILQKITRQFRKLNLN